MGAALDRIAPASVAKAARELRERLQPRSTEPTRVELAAFPEPGAEGFTVVEIPGALWDELSPDTIAELHLPPGVETRIGEFEWPAHLDRRRRLGVSGHRTSSSLAPRLAACCC
jgi:hypothetical protein